MVGWRYTRGHRMERGRNGMGEMKEFAGVYYREGALDPKTLQLVALAAMAAAGCTS
jgi:alkylhydroperoxidase/carboxymuconolactone decarboxylase family protein YurZ